MDSFNLQGYCVIFCSYGFSWWVLFNPLLQKDFDQSQLLPLVLSVSNMTFYHRALANICYVLKYWCWRWFMFWWGQGWETNILVSLALPIVLFLVTQQWDTTQSGSVTNTNWLSVTLTLSRELFFFSTYSELYYF